MRLVGFARIIAAIAAALFTLVKLLPSNHSLGTHSIDPALITIIGILVVEQTLRAVESFTASASSQKFEERIIKEIGKFSAVKYRGSGVEAAPVIFQILDSVSEVHNTYIGVTPTDYFSMSNYDISDGYTRIAKTAGLSWTDVVCDATGNYAKRWKNVDTANMKAVMTVHWQQASFPAVNFIILKYRQTNDREVWFGWGLADGHGNDSVFSSTDPLLLEYFERLHASLRHRVPIVQIATIRNILSGGVPTPDDPSKAVILSSDQNGVPAEQRPERGSGLRALIRRLRNAVRWPPFWMA
jgi:hypothetical protein